MQKLYFNKFWLTLSILLSMLLIMVECNSGSDTDFIGFCDIEDKSSVTELLASCSAPTAVSVSSNAELSSALSSVETCSTITVASGDYMIDTTISISDKNNIRIIGIEGETTISLDASTIQFDNVNGLLLKDLILVPTTNEAINIQNSHSVTIDALNVSRVNETDLTMYSSFGPESVILANVRYLNVFGSSFSGANDSAFSGNFIGHAIFEGNTFTNSTTGLELYTTCNININNNIFTRNAAGLLLYSFPDSAESEDVTILENLDIERTFRSVNITVSNNTFEDNNRPNSCTGVNDLSIVTILQDSELVFNNPVACQASPGSGIIITAIENLIYEDNINMFNLITDISLVHGIAFTLEVVDLPQRNYRFYATKNVLTSSTINWANVLVGTDTDEITYYFSNYVELATFMSTRFDASPSLADLRTLITNADDLDSDDLMEARRALLDTFKNLMSVTVSIYYLQETILDLLDEITPGTSRINFGVRDSKTALLPANILFDGVDRLSPSVLNENTHALCIANDNTGGRAGETLNDTGLPLILDVNIVRTGPAIVAGITLVSEEDRAGNDAAIAYLTYLDNFDDDDYSAFVFTDGEPGMTLNNVRPLLEGVYTPVKESSDPRLFYTHGGKFSNHQGLDQDTSDGLGVYAADSFNCTDEPLADGTSTTNADITSLVLQ